MSVTEYTTYNDVRALLGVSVDEIPDSVLNLGVYSNGLDLELTSISGILPPDTVERNLAEQYTYLSGLVPPLEADQTKMLLSIELYAAYFVADQVAGSLSMSAPKTQTDSKASLVRFSAESTFKSVQKDIKGALGKLAADFIELFGGTVTQFDPLLRVEPDVDLVVGEV